LGKTRHANRTKPPYRHPHIRLENFPPLHGSEPSRVASLNGTECESKVKTTGRVFVAGTAMPRLLAPVAILVSTCMFSRELLR
jgi:hypothetical protein